jgi:RNA polymerase sigma-70 factor (ECF subfamily)
MAESRTNQEWLDDLTAGGASQEAAVEDLRALLLRAALHFFGQNQGDMAGLSQSEIRQRAEDSAQDALLAVLGHLPEFRGDSRFTTWAYKFAINIALTTSRRERWKGVSLDDLVESGEGAFAQWVMEDKSATAAPEQAAIQAELRAIVQDVIERDLSDRQRRVLFLMAFNEVPMDVVVEDLGTNRNAVYKMLHDARRKLKSRLLAHGFEVGEMLTYFGARA